MLTWHVFRSVALGLTPLLWGWLAAAVARLTQATFLPWEARLQCCVDDLGLSIAGPSRLEWSCILARALVQEHHWHPCQLEKTRRGRRLEWIGSVFSAFRRRCHCVTRQDQRNPQGFQGVRGCAWDVLEAKACVHGWDHGLDVKRRSTRPTALVGSNSCHSEWRSSQRTQAQGTHLQTTGGTRSALALGSPAKRQPVQDAVCPCGHGRDIAVVHRRQCFSFWNGSHSLLIRVGSSGVLGIVAGWDSETFCAQKGDPAFQSEWESPALVCSVLVFSDLVNASRCQVSFMSDRKAALGAASWLRSPAALMGALAAEIALKLVEVKHIPGTSNKSANAVSRLSEGAALPQLLDHVPRLPAPDRGTAFKVWL